MTAPSQAVFLDRATLNTNLSASWRRLYTIGALAAFLAALGAILDSSLAILLGQAVPEPGQAGIIDWFDLFQARPFLGLYGLGLINLFYTALMVPLFLALAALHRRVDPARAGLAVVLVCLGAGLYIANNAALPMLSLSQEYAAATSETQRLMFASAGQALLARAEDFTPGSFLGFFISEVADLLMVLVMLRGGIFSKLSAWTGLAGFSLLGLFIVWATFFPVFYDAAMLVAMLGGLLSIAWFCLVARRLFQAARQVGEEA